MIAAQGPMIRLSWPQLVHVQGAQLLEWMAETLSGLDGTHAAQSLKTGRPNNVRALIEPMPKPFAKSA